MLLIFGNCISLALYDPLQSEHSLHNDTLTKFGAQGGVGCVHNCGRCNVGSRTRWMLWAWLGGCSNSASTTHACMTLLHTRNCAVQTWA